MKKEKLWTISLLALFAFAGNFLDNALFDKLDVTKNLIGSFAFGIITLEKNSRIYWKDEVRKEQVHRKKRSFVYLFFINARH